MMELREIDADTAIDFWKTYLWPDRASAVEPTSAMRLNGGIDMSYMDSTPYFVGAFDGRTLVGVNSGHATGSWIWRSRGLIVVPSHRGYKLGVTLLSNVLCRAKRDGALMVWSIPRVSAYHAYAAAGYVRCSQVFQTETSDSNCYAIASLRTREELAAEAREIDRERKLFYESRTEQFAANEKRLGEGRAMLPNRELMIDRFCEIEQEYL